MFLEPTITWVPSGFFGSVWLDIKHLCSKNKIIKMNRRIGIYG